MAASGGDGGPTGSVPEFNGLREFDAFLLVINGVPWEGAFNPALTPVSLNNVEGIEVLRGPAPVTYGATSFVGVIHIIHRTPGSSQNQVRVQGGILCDILKAEMRKKARGQETLNSQRPYLV